MKKVPYCQMTIKLDQLMFGSTLPEVQVVKDRADVIEAYLASCGWTWDEVLEEICNESKPPLQSRLYN